MVTESNRNPTGTARILDLSRELQVQRALDQAHLQGDPPAYSEARDLEGLTGTAYPDGLDIGLFKFGSSEFMKMFSKIYGLEEIGKTQTDTVFENETLEKVIFDRNKDIDIKYSTIERSPQTLELMDTSFYMFLMDTYGVEERDVERFYNENIVIAANFINWYIDQTFRSDTNTLSQKNEASFPPSRPSELAVLLLRKDVHPSLKFDIQRLFPIFFIACEITSKNWDPKIREAITTIRDLINSEVLSPDVPQGETVLITKEYSHDPDTNRVVSVKPKKPTKNEWREFKPHPLMMRKLKDSSDENPTKKNRNKTGNVTASQTLESNYIHLAFHTKGINETIAKILEKAYTRSSNSGKMIPGLDVVDYGRGWVVTECDNRNDRNTIRSMVSQILKSKKATELFGVRPDVKSDNDPDSKSSSNKYNFKRLQILIPGLPPVELQFFTFRDFVNSQVAFGSERQDGTYDGEAHSLRKLYKLGSIRHLLFDQRFTQYDLDEGFSHSVQSELEELNSRTLRQMRFTV